MRVNAFVGFLLAASLAACSQPGSQYLGKWQRIGDSQEVLEIVQNGDGFLIFYQGFRIPATLKENLLQVYIGRPSTISYIKLSDTLLMPSLKGMTEFKRSLSSATAPSKTAVSETPPLTKKQ